MSKVRLYGSTSGFVELSAPAISDDGVLVLPTAAQGFGPAGIGSNVVSVLKTDVFTTTSTSFVDVTGLAVTITPTSATSKILVVAQVTFSGASGQGYGHFKLSGGNTSVYVGDAAGSRVQTVFGGFVTANLSEGTYSAVLAFLDSPATTSATTYKVQARQATNGSAKVNASVGDADFTGSARGASTITVIEVAA